MPAVPEAMTWVMYPAAHSAEAKVSLIPGTPPQDTVLASSILSGMSFRSDTDR